MTDNVVILLLLLLMLLLSILPNFLRVASLIEVIVVIVQLLIVLLLVASILVLSLKLGPPVRLRGSALLGHPVSRRFMVRVSQDTFTMPSLRRLLRGEVDLFPATVVNSFWFWRSICIERLAPFSLSRKSLV